MAHWLIAWRCVRELGATQPDGGIPLPDVPPGYQLPRYMEWIVDWCFRIAQEQSPAGWALEVEGELEWEFEHFILRGHPDKYATSPDGKQGMDNDWKTGMKPVDPAACNWQVSSYMALRERIYGLDSIRYEIDQPFADEDEGFERQSFVELEGAALLKNTTTLEQYLNDSLSDQGWLNTGKHCLYCCGYRCPAIQQLHADMKLRLTPEMLAKVVKDMPEGELVDLVAEAKTLAKPIDDIAEQLKERLKDGHTAVSTSGATARVVESPGGYSVRDAVGMFRWMQGQLPEEVMAKSLSYPSGKVRDGIAEGLKIPKTSKTGISAKSVFEGAAAAYLDVKVKRALIIS